MFFLLYSVKSMFELSGFGSILIKFLAMTIQFLVKIYLVPAETWNCVMFSFVPSSAFIKQLKGLFLDCFRFWLVCDFHLLSDWLFRVWMLLLTKSLVVPQPDFGKIGYHCFQLYFVLVTNT